MLLQELILGSAEVRIGPLPCDADQFAGLGVASVRSNTAARLAPSANSRTTRMLRTRRLSGGPAAPPYRRVMASAFTAANTSPDHFALAPAIWFQVTGSFRGSCMHCSKARRP